MRGDGEHVLLTFGHGTASAEQIVDLLRGADVQLVVDIRTAPGSRRLPHVVRAELARWLPEHGIDYRWEQRLGGFRRADPESPDTAWRNASFRGYAGYTRTEPFRQALDQLLAEAAARRTAVMCAESVWWRCHRRIVADVVSLGRGWRVLHLGHDGRLTDHVPSEGVRVRDDGLLVWDGGISPLFDELTRRNPR
ncbi:MAG: DUF488 domain-containing protein [Acidothermus sp.]|nr:DUF488 domain-containing protein [Acidothermus sp.]MCL6537177.1 DUF488 domain-containing protein [Acidothermus sp.]